MEFKCKTCGAELLTNHKKYICPKCRTIQPIEDYKEAFENLIEQYENDRKLSGIALATIREASESYRKERNFILLLLGIHGLINIVLWLI